jgi:glycosyltransferase involved in cell wall biosynthesis
VRPDLTGVLAAKGDVTALAGAILGLLANREKRAELSANCRKIGVEEYSLDNQARSYLSIYTSLLEARYSAFVA